MPQVAHLQIPAVLGEEKSVQKNDGRIVGPGHLVEREITDRWVRRLACAHKRRNLRFLMFFALRSGVADRRNG
jgi:hypothetical protein